MARLVFDSEAPEVAPLAPAGRFDLLIVDLARGKDTRRILTDLNACFPDTPGAAALRVRGRQTERPPSGQLRSPAVPDIR